MGIVNQRGSQAFMHVACTAFAAAFIAPLYFYHGKVWDWSMMTHGIPRETADPCISQSRTLSSHSRRKTKTLGARLKRRCCSGHILVLVPKTYTEMLFASS